MIRQADGSLLCKIPSADPFYTRILSLYESYGIGYSFVDYWIQETGESTVAILSRFEDNFSLYLTDESDLGEIAAFLRFQGARSVLFNARYPLEIQSKKRISGSVLAYRDADYISDLELYEPEIKPFYELLRCCESDTFRVPAYMNFLSDVTHRRNLGRCHMLAASVDGRLASAAMTVCETDAAVILGAVATHPDYRRRGLSRELVRTLATRMRAGDRQVYVLSASDENTRFYQHSGFAITAGFTELFM